MSLEQLKENISSLSLSKRFTLVDLLLESLKSDLHSHTQLVKNTEIPPCEITIDKMLEYLHSERASLMSGMGGLLSTSQPSPSDQAVQGMLQQRQLEKFLQ